MSNTEQQPSESVILARIAVALGEWNCRPPQPGSRQSEDVVTTFRRDCEAAVEDTRQDPEWAEYDMVDLLSDIMSGEASSDFFGPFLAKVMGLPEDPWPGLTGDDLLRMTKGRVREARRRNIPFYPAPYEIPFKFKLLAAKHRAWLEQPSS